jgi:hypothetical protein
MYYKLICILYALLCGQNFILVKSGCYRDWEFPPFRVSRVSPSAVMYVYLFCNPFVLVILGQDLI